MHLVNAVELLPTFVETFHIFELFIYLVPSIDIIHFEIYVESNLQSIDIEVPSSRSEIHEQYLRFLGPFLPKFGRKNGKTRRKRRFFLLIRARSFRWHKF